MYRALFAACALIACLPASARAGECYTPPIFLVPVAVGIDGGGEKVPIPFDNSADVEAVLKGTSCENAFTTVAGEEVTFGWTGLRAEVFKTLTFTVLGPRPFVIQNRETVILPAGTWKLRIERPAPKVGRLEDLRFTLRMRFKGEYPPE